MAEPPAIRVSDAERERSVELLQQACGDGRISFEELAERIELAYNARTAGELEVVTRDLPAPPAAPDAAPAERDDKDWIVAVMGGSDRRGRWRPAGTTAAVAVMGGIDIDLRAATIDGPEVEIVAVAIMGGVDITVPDHVDVQISGFALMGGNEGPKDAQSPPPGVPVVRVKAYSIMGGVTVKRKPSKDIQRRIETLRSHWAALHGGSHPPREELPDRPSPSQLPPSPDRPPRPPIP